MRRTKPFAGRQPAGFILFWVLLLVVLIGLGLSTAARFESTIQQRDKEKELLTLGRQFRAAIASYYETQLAGRSHEYPASLDDLLKDNRFPFTKRHLRKVFIDPMTGRADWQFVLVGGRIAGVRSKSEVSPMKQAGFEPEDAMFAGSKKINEWAFTYPSDLLQSGQSNRTGVTGTASGTVSVPPPPERSGGVSR